eukprot:scaffold4786_cov198-Amphora_coffeaeformis.AAC.19
MSEPIMLDWIDKVWKPFAHAKREEGNLTVLIIDRMSVHLMPSVKKAIEECGTLLEYIPKGYTSRLQVCDAGLNKPFKDHMRATVHEWMILQGESVVKPDRPIVSYWIDHAWNKITRTTITNTWAHIQLAKKVTVPLEETVEEVPPSFLLYNDPQEDDVLALHDSVETSSDKEE